MKKLILSITLTLAPLPAVADDCAEVGQTAVKVMYYRQFTNATAKQLMEVAVREENLTAVRLIGPAWEEPREETEEARRDAVKRFARTYFDLCTVDLF